MDPLECLVTLKENVSVTRTLTDCNVTNVKKASTISHDARDVIVIPLVFLSLSQDVGHYQPASCASAKTEFREEFVISASHFSGTCNKPILMDARVFYFLKICFTIS